MLSYDPRGMTWDQYVMLMAELFAPQNLGYVTEDKWMDWAKSLNGIGYFVDSGVPDPRGFDNWQDWAKQMVGILSITPQQI